MIHSNSNIKLLNRAQYHHYFQDLIINQSKRMKLGSNFKKQYTRNYNTQKKINNLLLSLLSCTRSKNALEKSKLSNFSNQSFHSYQFNLSSRKRKLIFFQEKNVNNSQLFNRDYTTSSDSFTNILKKEQESRSIFESSPIQSSLEDISNNSKENKLDTELNVENVLDQNQKAQDSHFSESSHVLQKKFQNTKTPDINISELNDLNSANDNSSFVMKTLTLSIRSISTNYLKQDINSLTAKIVKSETEKSLNRIKEYIQSEEKEFFGEEKFLVASVSMQILNKYEQTLRKLGVSDIFTFDLDLMESWIEIFYLCDYKEQIYELYEKIKGEILLKGNPNIIPEEEINEKDSDIKSIPKEGEEITEEGFTEIVDTGKFTSSRVEDRHFDLIDIVPEFKDLKTFYKIIDTLSHVSRTEYVIFIINYLQDKQIGMVPETFKILIETCERDGATDIAMEYFDRMHRNNVKPNAGVIAALLKVFISAGDDQFLDIYKSYVENNVLQESESTLLNNILIHGLTEVVHDFTTTLSLLDYLEKTGRKITQEDYQFLFDAAYKRGSKLDTIQIYEHMTQRNIPCNLNMCEKICLTYAKHGDPKTFQIYNVLNQKYEFNDKKTIEIYNAFIQVASIHHNHAKVKQLMNQMRMNGMRPNVVSHLHYGSSLYHTNWKAKMEASLQSKRIPQLIVSKVPEDELPFVDDMNDENLFQTLTYDNDIELSTKDVVEETMESLEYELEELDSPKKTDITAMNQDLKREIESILGRQGFKDLLLQAQVEYQQDKSGFISVPETSEELFASGPQPITFDEDFVPMSVTDLFDSIEYEKMHTERNLVDHQLLTFLTKRAESTIKQSSQTTTSLESENDKNDKNEKLEQL